MCQAWSCREASWLWVCSKGLGWHIVVMGLIIQDQQPTHYASMHWTQWKKDLTSVVEDFHRERFVHVDLRGANFIVPAKEPGRILLIDFNWDGEPGGVVSSPTRLLHEDLTEGKAAKSHDLVITKGHGFRVFTESLRSSSLPACQHWGTQMNTPWTGHDPFLTLYLCWLIKC